MTVKSSNQKNDYIFIPLQLYGVTLIFSLLSMLFLLDGFPAWSRILLGAVFVIPQLVSNFLIGKRVGERAFKRNKSSDANGRLLSAPCYEKAIIYLLPYMVPLVLVLLLSLIIKNLTLRAIVIIGFLMPVTLLFSGMGAVGIDYLGWSDAAVFLPAILLYGAAFIYGYISRDKFLRRREGAIRSELRSFDN